MTVLCDVLVDMAEVRLRSAYFWQYSIYNLQYTKYIASFIIILPLDKRNIEAMIYIFMDFSTRANE